MYSDPLVAEVRPRGLVLPALTLDTLAGYLLPISTLYLAIPHFIFFIGWLRWPWAALASLGVGGALFFMFKYSLQFTAQRQGAEERAAEQLEMAIPDNLTADAETPLPSSTEAALIETKPADPITKPVVFTRQHALMIVAVCVMWLTLSGVGGFVQQDNDWQKHNVVLNSLDIQPWPTVIEAYQEKIPLVYYIAYYLPASVVGKVAGWFWANQALFLWSLIGLIMAALWFCILVRRVSYTVLLIFVFFSGLDVFGMELTAYLHMPNAERGTWLHMDPWALLWQYSSNSTLLFWVPHQALAGWIVTGAVLYCLVYLRRRELLLLPVGLSAFWSPFVTIGLIPYLALDFLVDSESLGTRIRRVFSLPNLGGMLAVALTGFYFSAKASSSSPVVITSMFSGWGFSAYDGPIYAGIAYLLFFCLVEFGLYAIILYRSGAIQEERWRWMLDITVMTLAILPWFKLGVYNDLVMRSSIPALFALGVIVTRAVLDKTLERQTRLALVVLLLIGAITSGIEIRRHLQWIVQFPAPIFVEGRTPHDFIDYFQDEPFFFGQYSGGLDSPFFQYAAKAAPASPPNETNEHEYILYANRIYLLKDAVILPPEIGVGETITVPMELRFYGPTIRTSLSPSFRMVGEDGTVIWATNAWPNGHPHTEPFDMTTWTESVTVTVPLTTTPGIYQLEAGFRYGDTPTFLEARSVPDEELLGELVPVASTQVVKKE